MRRTKPMNQWEKSPSAMIDSGAILSAAQMTASRASLPPFPDSDRVVYRRNPLVDVICQLRFPPILRIVTEIPSAFQERIRGEYPVLAEKIPDVNLQFPTNIPEPIAELVRQNFPKPKLIGYDFASADEKWRVSLTRDFISLSTPAYLRWEEFREHLEGPLRALVAEYGPPFFTRIGLRYQDVIQRSRLDLEEQTKWRDLMKPYVVGPLAATELDGFVEESQSQLLIALPEFSGKARINYGIVRAADTNEECFLIDSDYYTEERTETDAVDKTLTYFNKQSGRAFRWCVEDRLQAAMDPQPLDALS